MKRIYKYVTLAVLALMSLISCRKEWSVDLDFAYYLESIDFSIQDEFVMVKLYVDNTGSTTLPMVAGESLTIGYTTVPDLSEVTMPGILWSSSDETVATVDQDGTITAVSEGVAVITVQPSTINLTATASLKVTVTDSVVPVTSIDITDDATMTDEKYGLPSCYIGETMQLTATVHPDDATYRTVFWSSADERIAVVDHISGVVTGVSSGQVAISATSLDEDRITATHDIYIDQTVTPVGIRITDTPDRLSVDETAYTISFDTYPALSTASLLSWTSSDETVATVNGGVITVRSLGRTTITVTCPDTDESVHEGYSKTLSFVVTVPAGYYNEHLLSADTKWTAGNNDWGGQWDKTLIDGDYAASYTRDYNSRTGEWFFNVKPSLSGGTTGRADLMHNKSETGVTTYLDPVNYPILCFRLDDMQDLYGYSRNITLDTNGTDGNNSSCYGGIGGSNNKWIAKYACSDGSCIIYYDLKSQELETGLLTTTAELFTFQLKYADIETIDTSNDNTYRFFWFMTFATENDMKDYLKQWSEETGITYEE